MRKLVMMMLVLLVVVAAGAGTRGRRALAQSPVPNVLVIVTDDQRREGTLGVMDGLRRTFKRVGMDFTNAYATTPLCCPSRGSIWTGQYAHNHGMQSNDGTDFDEFDHDGTIQAYLQRAGYRTAYFGKYFNKWPLQQPPPYFDQWAINSRGSDYRLSSYNVNGRTTTVVRYDTAFIAEQLTAFIEDAEADDERPWFAVLAPKAPHGPAIPHPRYKDERVPHWPGSPAVFEEDRTDKHPDVQARHESLRRALDRRENQLRTLMSVDDAIESTFATLRGSGEVRSTVAIYLSDNGILWREHGIMAKSQPFTPSIHVPLFMRGPGIPQGVVDDRLVANIDIAPTILDLVDITPDEEMDGVSVFDGTERDRLLLEYWRSPDFEHTGKWAGTLTPTYQYVEYYEDADPQDAIPSFREYYDLAEDPWQLQNLFGDLDPTNDPNPLLLHQQLQEDRACAGENCP